jgi:hypothetical protein
VVQVQPSRAFGVFGVSTATGLKVPWVSLYSSANWTNGIGFCNGDNLGSFSYTCQTQSNDAAGQAVMLVTPSTAPTPVGYTMQGVCERGCVTPPPTTLTSVSPAVGTAGALNQVVVRGTGLTLGTELDLAGNGIVASNYQMNQAVSVSADGTSLTVLFSTYGRAPGKYDLVLNGVGYTVGTPSPGYLPGAYTVTPAPAPQPNSLFTPLTPSRILDTRLGIGAPRARVGARRTVKLQVDNTAGVPAGGVTAVAMNLTAVTPTNAGFVTVYPDSRPLPTVSNLNFSAGQTIPNLVVVPVIDGRIDFYNGSGGTVQLIADLDGYYTT